MPLSDLIDRCCSLLRSTSHETTRAHPPPLPPPFSAAGTAKRTAPAQTPRPTFWLGAIMRILAFCDLCICLSVPCAGREAPRRRQQKNDRWEGEVEAPVKGEGGAPSAVGARTPGRAAGARGPTAPGRGGRGGADSGPSGEADALGAVRRRRRRRRDAATTTTSDGKVRRGGLRLSVSRSLSPSLAGPRRPSSPRAAPPKPWSAPF